MKNYNPSQDQSLATKGRQVEEEYAAKASEPDGLDQLSLALFGVPASEIKDPQQLDRLKTLLAEIENGEIEVDWNWASADDLGGDADVAGAYVEGGGIYIEEGLSGSDLRTTTREEFGEAIGARARELGLTPEDGDVGYRLERMLDGETFALQDQDNEDVFTTSSTDTTFVMLDLDGDGIDEKVDALARQEDTDPVAIWEEYGFTYVEWSDAQATAREVQNQYGSNGIRYWSQNDGWQIMLNIYGDGTTIDEDGLTRAIADGAVVIHDIDFGVYAGDTSKAGTLYTNVEVEVNLNNVPKQAITEAIFNWVAREFDDDHVDYISAQQIDDAISEVLNDRKGMDTSDHSMLEYYYKDPDGANADRGSRGKAGISRAGLQSALEDNTIEVRANNYGKDNLGVFTNERLMQNIDGVKAYGVTSTYGFAPVLDIESVDYMIDDDVLAGRPAVVGEFTVRDDSAIDEADVTVSGGANPNAFEVNSDGELVTTKDLAVGEYTVELEIKDANGNVTRELVTIVIAQPESAPGVSSPKMDAVLANLDFLLEDATNVEYVYDDDTVTITGRDQWGPFSFTMTLGTNNLGKKTMTITGTRMVPDGPQRYGATIPSEMEPVTFVGAEEIEAATLDFNTYIAHVETKTNSGYAPLNELRLETFTGSFQVAGDHGNESVHTEVKMNGEDQYTVEYYDEATDTWHQLGNKSFDGPTWGSTDYATIHRPEDNDDWQLSDVKLRVTNDSTGVVTNLQTGGDHIVTTTNADGSKQIDLELDGDVNYSDVQITLRGDKTLALPIDGTDPIVSEAPDPPVNAGRLYEINEAAMIEYLELLEAEPEGSDGKILSNLYRARSLSEGDFDGYVDIDAVNADIVEYMNKDDNVALLETAMDTAATDIIGMTGGEAADALSEYLLSDEVETYLATLSPEQREAFIDDYITQIAMFDADKAKETYDTLTSQLLTDAFDYADFDHYTPTDQAAAVGELWTSVISLGRQIPLASAQAYSLLGQLPPEKFGLATKYYAAYISQGGTGTETEFAAYLEQIGAPDEIAAALKPMHSHMRVKDAWGGLKAVMGAILVVRDLFGGDFDDSDQIINATADLMLATSGVPSIVNWLGRMGLTPNNLATAQQDAIALNHILGDGTGSAVETALAGVDLADEAAVRAALNASPDAKAEIAKGYAYAKGDSTDGLTATDLSQEDYDQFVNGLVTNSSTGEARTARENLNEATTIRDAAQGSVTALTNRTDALATQHADKSAEIVTITDARDAKQGEVTAAQGIVDTRKTEWDTAQTAKNAADKAVTDQEQDIADKKLAIADLEDEHTAAVAAQPAAETKQANALDAKTAADGEKAGAITAQATAQTNYDDAVIATAAAQDEYNTAVSSGAPADEIAAKQSSLTGAKTTESNMLGALGTAETETTRATTAAATAQTEFETADSELTAANNLVTNKAAAITTAEGELATLEADLPGLKLFQTAKQTAFDSADTVLNNVTKSRDDRQGELDEANENLTKAEGELTAIEAEQTKVAGELTTAQDALTAAEPAVTAAQGVVDSTPTEGRTAENYFQAVKDGKAEDGTVASEMSRTFVDPGVGVLAGTLESPQAAYARAYNAELQRAGGTEASAKAAGETASNDALNLIEAKAVEVAKKGGATNDAALEVGRKARSLAAKGVMLTETGMSGFQLFAKGAGLMGEGAGLLFAYEAGEDSYDYFEEGENTNGVLSAVQALGFGFESALGLAIMVGAPAAALGPAGAIVGGIAIAASIGQFYWQKHEQYAERQDQIRFLEGEVGTVDANGDPVDYYTGRENEWLGS